MSVRNPARYMSRDLYNDPTDINRFFPPEKPFEPLIGVDPQPDFYDPRDISRFFPENRPYFDPLFSGAAQPGGPIAGLTGPFARQKRELPALGYSSEQIAMLDQGLEALRQMDGQTRRKEFRKFKNMYRMMGMTEEEIENLRKHLGIEVTTIREAAAEQPWWIRPFAQDFATEAGLAESLAIGGEDIAKGYGQFVHKPLTELGVGMRKKINDARAKARAIHPFANIPPTTEVKEVVGARNWKKLNQWADIGRMPTFDEMGPDYFRTVMGDLKDELEPLQFRAAQKVMAYAFTNPSSSWYRRGVKAPELSNKFIAEHPVLAVAPLILSAPEEWVEHQVTHPETWPFHAAMFVGGKYVINPATKGFLNWLNPRFPVSVPLKQAWRYNKAYRAARKFGKGVPVSNEMVADFFQNLTHPDIASRIPIAKGNPEANMMLEAMEGYFRGLSPEEFGHFRLFFDKSPTGDLTLFVPKDLSTLRQFSSGTAFAPGTVAGQGLLAGPGAISAQAVTGGIVAPGVAAADVAAAATLPGVAAPRITGPGEFGAGEAAAGAPSVPLTQRPTPGPTAEQMTAQLLTSSTGFTADEISLAIRAGVSPETVQQLRMIESDEQILQMGMDRMPAPTDTVQDSLMLKPTSRVTLPFQGDLQGTVISIADPQAVVVELDEGGDIRVPAEQLTVIANPAKDVSTVPIQLAGEGIPLAGGGIPPAITGTPEFVEKWFAEGTISDDLLVRYPHLAKKYGVEDRYMQALARAREEYMTQGKVDMAVASVTNPSTGDVDIPPPPAPARAGIPEEPPAPYTMPLENYILNTAPREITTIRNIKASLPFKAGDDKAIARYFRAVQRAVDAHMPGKSQELATQIKAYYRGQVTLGDIDQIYASGIHRGLAEAQFTDAIQTTGIQDPMEAAQAYHRGSVESALATNPDSVADEVLIDYPDLADKYGRRDIGRETKKGLRALGYTDSEIASLKPSVRVRLLSNKVAAGNVTIMDDGDAYFSAWHTELSDPKSYKVERTVQDVEKAVAEDIEAAKLMAEQIMAEQLKLALGGEEGFALIPSVATFKAVGDRIHTRAKRIFAPTMSDIFRDTMGAVEKWRSEYNHAGLLVEWSDNDLRKSIMTDDRWWNRAMHNRFTKTGKGRQDMMRTNLAIVDDWMENPIVNQARLDALPSAWKQLANTLRSNYNTIFAYANVQGVEITWRDNYSPGMYKNPREKTLNAMYPGSGKLSTRMASQRPKKYANKAEARADGLDPVEDPIFKNSMYTLALHRAVANKKLVTTMMTMFDRDTGAPIIMFKPREAGVYMDAWQGYKTIHDIPGLSRLRFSNTHDGIPVLINESTRAHPEAYNILHDVFQPYVRPPTWLRRYNYVRGLVKRGKMYNPAIHTWNILSDALDEMNFNPVKVVRVFKEGKRMYDRDAGIPKAPIAQGSPMWTTHRESIEFAVKSGLETATSLSAANELRRQFRVMDPSLPSWMEPDSALAKGTTQTVRLWRDLLHASDKILWHSVVLYAQLGTWKEVCFRMAKHHPDWDAQKVAETASVYVNTLYGTLPHTWMRKWTRILGNNIFFARNWTFANMNLAAYAVTGGRRGMGTRGLGKDQQSEVWKHAGWHLIKGMIALIATANLLQQGVMRIKNQLAKEGIIDDPIEKPRWTWENESARHLFDVYIGKNKRGQDIYLVPGLFRYFRDYVGWGTEPRQTFVNKTNPLPKLMLQSYQNYDDFMNRQIWDEDAPKKEQIKQGIDHFIKTLTPLEQLGMPFGVLRRPGTVPTKREWVAPFLGMWVRRGAPGGKYTSLMYEYLDEEKRRKYLLDKEISEQIQDIENTDMSELITNLMARYKSMEGISGVFYKHNAWLNATWDALSKDDKLGYQLWLQEHGESMTDFHLARALEFTHLSDRMRADDEDPTMTLDDMKQQELEQDLQRSQGQTPIDPELQQMLEQFGTQ